MQVESCSENTDLPTLVDPAMPSMSFSYSRDSTIGTGSSLNVDKNCAGENDGMPPRSTGSSPNGIASFHSESMELYLR